MLPIRNKTGISINEILHFLESELTDNDVKQKVLELLFKNILNKRRRVVNLNLMVEYSS
jgi:hypothetical protein